MRRRPAEEFEAVAERVDRLAALVAAGAGPSQSWRYLAQHAQDPGEERLAAAVAVALSTGDDVLAPFLAIASAEPRRGAAWLRVGLLVRVATEAGAPLGAALRRGGDGLRDAAELQRSVEVATAGPIASARLMLALPPCAVLLAEALGFDAVRVLVTTPLGGSALALAALLLTVAARWGARLRRRAAAVDHERGAVLELTALAVRAGLPVDTARARAAELARRAGFDSAADLVAVDEAAEFGAASGVPLAALLDAEAHRVRRSVRTDGLRAAAALQARLLLPLGALVLPAFLLLGAVPIGIAVLSSTATPF
jgi:tight adherence protein B